MQAKRKTKQNAKVKRHEFVEKRGYFRTMKDFYIKFAKNSDSDYKTLKYDSFSDKLKQLMAQEFNLDLSAKNTALNKDMKQQIMAQIMIFISTNKAKRVEKNDALVKAQEVSGDLNFESLRMVMYKWSKLA